MRDRALEEMKRVLGGMETSLEFFRTLCSALHETAAVEEHMGRRGLLLTKLWHLGPDIRSLWTVARQYIESVPEMPSFIADDTSTTVDSDCSAVETSDSEVSESDIDTCDD